MCSRLSMVFSNLCYEAYESGQATLGMVINDVMDVYNKMDFSINSSSEKEAIVFDANVLVFYQYLIILSLSR